MMVYSPPPPRPRVLINLTAGILGLVGFAAIVASVASIVIVGAWMAGVP